MNSDRLTLQEEIFRSDDRKEQELRFPNNDKKKKKETMRVDNLFPDYSRVDESSLWEEKFRLNIFKIFIEFFSMKERIHLKDLMDGIERMIIVRVLSHFGGNQKNAAAFLRLKYTTLNEKIRKYNIRTRKKIY